MALQNTGTLLSWSLQFSYVATPVVLQMPLEPLQSASTTQSKAGSYVLAEEQAFAELASDMQGATVGETGGMLQESDAAGEFLEEEATDDFVAAFDLALESEFTFSL
ncbi:hypothetical protein Pla144_16960 [Bythopirellula polymerisocia]|uniref:Uncharacterized protein n=1 Tax=Bythopirellula polymerisocia TaxID=2528003 RepID=A0A5C6CVC9_9BACT|nr:hypothetical protein Pla144_16960 [Bythopirellula polymerisocia]